MYKLGQEVSITSTLFDKNKKSDASEIVRIVDLISHAIVNGDYTGMVESNYFHIYISGKKLSIIRQGVIDKTINHFIKSRICIKTDVSGNYYGKVCVIKWVCEITRVDAV